VYITLTACLLQVFARSNRSLIQRWIRAVLDGLGFSTVKPDGLLLTLLVQLKRTS
jgi:hypothetical protein